MKRFLILLAIVVVAVIAVLAIAPFVIPVDTYKNQIAKRVEAATGRQLTIAGDIGLSLLPRTQLTVGGVSFANAAWAERDTMAELQSLKVRVNPWSLLQGALDVEQFVLEKPVIHLAVSPEGEPNWAFGEAAPADTGAGGEQAPADEGGAPMGDLSLRDVRLVDGTVTYTDMAAGTTQTLEKVNLALDLKTLDAPFSADGALTWRGEPVELTLETGAPRGLMTGEPTDVALDVDSKHITLAYDGTVTNAQPRKIAGDVDLKIPSVKALAAWTGNPVPAREDALETFRLAGTVDATGQQYAFTAKELRLDAMQGDGSVGVDLSGAKPFLTGNLAFAELDVTPYMPPPTKDGEQQADGADDGGAPADWSDEPIDFSALSTLNADVEVSAEALKARDIQVGRSALALGVRDSRLQLDLKQLELYDGSGSGQVVVNARTDVPSFASSMAMKGVAARPLLKDSAGFDRLEGTGTISYDVQAEGRSQKAMIANLDGKGAIAFENGAIRGINLAQMVRNVKTAFTGGGGTQKTDFAELAGTFTITDGVLKNDDLLLLNPLLRVRGEGTSNILKRTVDYRITPKAVASTKGQGGETDRSGIAVPVVVSGPWHDLSYKPDLESAIKSAVQDPGKVKQQAEETLKRMRSGGGVGEALKGLTGGGDTGGDDTEDGEQQQNGGSSSPADKAKDAIDKLFGN
ncbi:AsmA protein [Limimonas halophila]|uniref:AsmA protein n=1 Tax=Limimonas halophila TaxID=1082479 RepID=A0A1G7T4D7_9PROT|nr:AsmA family protein [Limimonas halophila]SDG30173.1 AsmA protein [Limimonas halophila]